MMRFIFCICTVLLIGQISLGQDTRIAKVKDYMLEMEANGFSGSILIANKSEVLHKSGYGMSQKEERIANSPSTLFDIGSITKQFTAAAILKLEMLGKLSVKDKIELYFDKLPQDKKEITIHHLLTHSAGFPPAIGDDYETVKTEAFLQKAMDVSLLFEPGKGYEYSNVGYSLLGILIEELSGLSYEKFLNLHLFKPANMAQTGYLLPAFSKDKVAIGYGKNGRPWARPNEKNWDIDGPFWNLKANGGIISSVEDMYKWHLALLKNGILSQSAREKYFTPYVREGRGANSHYGYGWAIYETSRGSTLAAHNGGNGIFFADFWRYLDDDLVIILMSNQSNRKVERIAEKIGAIYFSNKYTKNTQSSVVDNTVDGRDMKIVETLLEVFRSKKQDVWRQFIESNCTSDFVNMLPMTKHLEYFEDFHQDFKSCQLKGITKEDSSLLVDIKTSEGDYSITISTIEIGNKLKIEGLLVD